MRDPKLLEGQFLSPEVFQLQVAAAERLEVVADKVLCPHGISDANW